MRRAREANTALGFVVHQGGASGMKVLAIDIREPHNPRPRWVGFNFSVAFKRPVKVINDAAMQALGDYRHGNMLFLGLGTGLGSAMIVESLVVPMELAHLPYKNGTYEDYVGIRGLKRLGKRRWTRYVEDVVERLKAALEPNDTVIGGGNAKNLQKLPRGCRAGSNAAAFTGGVRLWTNAGGGRRAVEKASVAPPLSRSRHS